MSEEAKLSVVIDTQVKNGNQVNSLKNGLTSSSVSASELKNTLGSLNSLKFPSIFNMAQQFSKSIKQSKDLSKNWKAIEKTVNSIAKHVAKNRGISKRKAKDNLGIGDGLKEPLGENYNRVLATLQKSGAKEVDGIKGQYKFKDWKKAIKTTMKEMRKEISKTIPAWQKQLGALIVIYNVIKKLIDAALELSQVADDIDKNSQKVGMSTDTYQEWAYVLDRCGISVSSLQTAMRGLQRNMSTVESLGLKGSSLEETFENCVAYVQNLNDEFSKLNAATSIFGRNASEMLTLFNMSNDDTAKLRKWFTLIGGRLPNSFTSESATLQDNLTDIKNSLQGLKTALIGWIVPLINKLMPSIIMLVSRFTILINAMFNIGSDGLDTVKNKTKSTTEATEELKRSLAGFDDLEILSSDSSSDSNGILGLSSVMTDENIQELELFAVKCQMFFTIKLPYYIDRFKNWFNNFLGPLLSGIFADVQLLMAQITKADEEVIDELKGKAEDAWTQVGSYRALEYKDWLIDNKTVYDDLEKLCNEKWGIDITRPDIAAEIESATTKLNSLTTAKWILDIQAQISWKMKKIDFNTQFYKSDANQKSELEANETEGMSNWQKFWYYIGQYLMKQGNGYASGGVITTPTVGLIGEYSNARSNPEIVTPQNIMYETVTAANNGLADVYIQCTRQLISAIEDNKTEVTLDGTTIARSVAKANNNYRLQTGGSLL